MIHESVASTGTCICIRKTPPVQRITPKKALEEHYCEEKVLHLLANCVKAKLNMVFCGEPGVGKTECAKFLTAFIPPEQKVITVEDTKEVHYREINPEKDCVELKVNEYFSYNDAMTEVLRHDTEPCHVIRSTFHGSKAVSRVLDYRNYGIYDTSYG